jgi:hypothetical protein
MNRLQQRQLTSQEPEPNLNARLLSNGWTGSLLAYCAIRVCLRERNIKERDIGERNIGERGIGKWDIGETDIGETVSSCRFAE